MRTGHKIMPLSLGWMKPEQLICTLRSASASYLELLQDFCDIKYTYPVMIMFGLWTENTKLQCLAQESSFLQVEVGSGYWSGASRC